MTSIPVYAPKELVRSKLPKKDRQKDDDDWIAFEVRANRCLWQSINSLLLIAHMQISVDDASYLLEHCRVLE